MYVWLIYGRCWRSIIIISLFYGLRGLCNSFFLLQTPNNLIWDFPGLWSFSVSYHQTTDFFFSGHVGINLISSIELDRLGFKKTPSFPLWEYSFKPRNDFSKRLFYYWPHCWFACCTLLYFYNWVYTDLH